MARRIFIFDTTLRDGAQSPGVGLSVQEKLEIAKQLARLNVDVIEAGFPASSPGEFEAVRTVAEKISGPAIAGLARVALSDIDSCWEAVKASKRPRIHTFIATSDVHMKYKLRMTPEQVLDAVDRGVRHARHYCQDVEFSPEDASRTDLGFLLQVIAVAVKAGAQVINIPDTVGFAIPEEFGRFIKSIIDGVPGMDQTVLSVHCHNDLGLAVANSLAAIENGAAQIECTVNGIGERAGNTALEEIVMALFTRRDIFGAETAIRAEEIYRTSRLVSSLTGMPVQYNKAVVGRNAFHHASGIHQDGVLKERTTYEIMNPDTIGLVTNHIVLGKYSGRHAFRHRLEMLGYTLEDVELEKAFTRFKNLADHKSEITDSDLEAIVRHEIKTIPEKFRLRSLHISSGTHVVPAATVDVIVDGTEQHEAALGEGPVDATFKAIDRVSGLGVALRNYNINAVGGGKDAMGEVTVQVEYEGRGFLGRGLSTDIIEASAKAYVNALNKLALEFGDEVFTSRDPSQAQQRGGE